MTLHHQFACHWQSLSMAISPVCLYVSVISCRNSLSQTRTTLQWLYGNVETEWLYGSDGWQTRTSLFTYVIPSNNNNQQRVNNNNLNMIINITTAATTMATTSTMAATPTTGLETRIRLEPQVCFFFFPLLTTIYK